MLRLELKRKLLSNGVYAPNTWIMKTLRCSKSKAHKILNGKLKCINPEDLTRICVKLQCKPDDLFIWDTKSRVKLPEEHTLRNLIPQTV